MKDKLVRNRIIYLPYKSQRIKVSNPNQYTLNMVDLLKDEYYVTGDIDRVVNLSQIVRTKAIFLNWVESTGLNRRLKVLLLLYQRLGTKLIWVFHNKYPHDSETDVKKLDNMRWIADQCDVIILHSKCSLKYIPNAKCNRKKAVYIPHIVYNISRFTNNLDFVRNKYKIAKDDFVFTIIGNIRPYKNIESGIEEYRKLNLKRAKLLIAGKPINDEYARKIANMCKKDASIVIELRYLPDAALDAVLDISDVILMPYKDKSSMNSGVMIQSFSKGKTVIAPDICMARDLVSYNFLYMYYDSLADKMLEAYQNGKEINRQMGERAREYVYKHNNRQIVKNKIYNILK